MFTNDFVLRYFHRDGTEDRAECSALGVVVPGQLVRYAVGAYGSSVRLDDGAVRLALAFPVAGDVENVELLRTGATSSVSYRIGADRTYSVELYTHESALIPQTEEVIRKGGYRVTASGATLAGTVTESIIHYAQHAENAAREISQRLIATFGRVPSVRKMDLASDVDSVV